MVEELARADDAISACVHAPAWPLPEHDLIAALDAAHRLQQRLAAVTLTLIREVDGRGTARTQGASSTAVWLRERLRLTVPAARRLIDLATALDTGNPGIREAPHHRPPAPSPRATRPRLRLPRLRPSTPLVRRPPHPPLGRWRPHQPRQRRPALRPPPSPPAPQRLDRATR
ncbi:DUF222 domain-containing protein [Micromonospora sp. NPDC000663]|uniref:DUF222 domain-containing protein n=1 Tax=Micromonospora sp. NPDC000663 TaxID=3364218 RepID=UPI003676EC78